MKFLIRLLLIGGLSYLGLQFFGWWIIAIIAFLVGLIFSEKRPRRLFGKTKPPALAFLAGFLAIAGVWGGMAYFIDQQNASLLSQKVYDILSSGASTGIAPHWSMIGVTASVGGLLGGFATMTGNLLGEALKN